MCVRMDNRNFAGKSALKLAQTKPDILELINLKLKKNEEEEDGESLKREEITKLLNNSDGSDQIDVKNIDLQIFKSGKNHVMYNSSYDFENIIMESSSSLSSPPQQQQNDNNNRKRHVSESCLDGKMRMGKNFSVSRSSSLEMLPKIEEVREVYYYHYYYFKIRNRFGCLMSRHFFFSGYRNIIGNSFEIIIIINIVSTRIVYGFVFEFIMA